MVWSSGQLMLKAQTDWIDLYLFSLVAGMFMSMRLSQGLIFHTFRSGAQVPTTVEGTARWRIGPVIRKVARKLHQQQQQQQQGLCSRAC